ncbi:MAG: DUF3667 domain-containing protein [Salinivirgaceae bacterium]|jgi:hypothetical protein|nr:DUF3667 domain-containing protein [Salinivirgaceae bacterium]
MVKKYVGKPNIICKNCETKFVGNFCPSCGQSIKDYDQPFGFIMYDLVGNIFAFDTRLLRTLKSILFNPGKMAQEFILGHRVRYMPPFRFYIFVSFIFFLLLSTSTKDTINKENSWLQINYDDSTAFISDSSTKNVDSVLIVPKFKYDKKTGKLIQEVDSLKKDPKNKGNIYSTDIKDIKENPEIYLQLALKYFSWSLFFLMPIYAFLLWLFFKRKYKNYIGHLIFGVNQHAFLFIILIIIMATNIIFKNSNLGFMLFLLILVPAYSLIGARNLYKRRWISVFFRLCTIYFIYTMFLSSAVIVILKLTFDM